MRRKYFLISVMPGMPSVSSVSTETPQNGLHEMPNVLAMRDSMSDQEMISNVTTGMHVNQLRASPFENVRGLRS